MQFEPLCPQLLAPDKVLIPERYLDLEVSAPLSPEEQREKQKKVERIKTLIAKSRYPRRCQKNVERGKRELTVP